MGEMSPIELSLVIPVFNEALNVKHLYEEIAQVLDEQTYRFEILFVDDGSTDDTAAAILQLHQQDPRVRLVRHKKNYGQSAGLVSGALAAVYPWLVTLDGDGQNDPRDIPRLFAALTSPKVVVFGNRVKRDDSVMRRLSSRIGNGIRQRLLNDDCPDTGCSLKLFSREAFLRLPHFNHLHRFLPALFKRAGYQIINLPVHHRPRQYGVSKYGVMNRVFVGIYDLIGVRWLIQRPCSPEATHES